MAAAVGNSAKVIKQLLTAGAEPYAQDTKDGFTALQLAAHCGNALALRTLLDHDVEIPRSTAKDWNPLALALRHASYDAAEVLLDAGVDVNAPQPLGRVTPLSFAASYGNAAIVARLLALGADPHVKDRSGATALDTARRSMSTTPSRRTEYEEIVRRLEAAQTGKWLPRIRGAFRRSLRFLRR